VSQSGAATSEASQLHLLCFKHIPPKSDGPFALDPWESDVRMGLLSTREMKSKRISKVCGYTISEAAIMALMEGFGREFLGVGTAIFFWGFGMKHKKAKMTMESWFCFAVFDECVSGFVDLNDTHQVLKVKVCVSPCLFK
jgi:hypothetical protein